MKPYERGLAIEGSSRIVARDDGRLGSILVQEGKLAPDAVERVLDLQRSHGVRFGEAAIRLGLTAAEDVRGAIARQYGAPYLLAGKGDVGEELVVACRPDHIEAEQLRALRTQLVIRWANARPRRRMVAIVSPGSGEGRSYLAANLAVAFAQLGERTLLVDADLRAPRQHQIFDVADRVGLSAIVSGRAEREAIVPFPEFGRLSILPAGACPPNPQELLLRPALAVLLGELAEEFDVVLLDTPPARAFADAQSLAFRAGSAIVLARKDHTRVADTAAVMRDLGVTGAQILGTVLNAF
jgi:chain length determinant protein tyrosine kinase EpsG